MEAVPAASRAGSSRDRLSELPDCLLHSVLSSLRSRQVVQSCVLSRRWRHLWRSVQCLDVDQRDFLLVDPEPEAPVYHDSSDAAWHVYTKAQDERLDREMKRQRCFEDFADAVLLFHGARPLDACRLHVADRDLLLSLHRWVRRGLARHPAELRVAYGAGYRSHHDDPTFSLDLVSGGRGALSVTSRLRRLHLSGLTLSERFAEELRSECPVLEDLGLVDCEYSYRFEGRIASSSIKRLHIEGLHGSNSSLRSLRTLALPALVSLNLDKVCLPDIEDELQSLAVASISYPDEYACEYRFLKSMRNVRVLELRSFTTTGLLQEEPEIFREFHNLRTLILIECDIGERCQVLRYILENVSNLERLVLQDCEACGFCRGESASSWCGTAFHGCMNLKSIQVKYEDHDVPYVLVDVLTQIAKDVVKTHRGKRDYVGWLDWMRRVVGWQKKFLTRQPRSDMLLLPPSPSRRTTLIPQTRSTSPVCGSTSGERNMTGSAQSRHAVGRGCMHRSMQSPGIPISEKKTSPTLKRLLASWTRRRLLKLIPLVCSLVAWTPNRVPLFIYFCGKIACHS